MFSKMMYRYSSKVALSFKKEEEKEGEGEEEGEREKEEPVKKNNN